MVAGLNVAKTGQWERSKVIVNSMTAGLAKAQKQATLKEAQLMRKEIVTGIRTGSPGGKTFKPLAATTLAVRAFKGRGGKKPLIVSGSLRNSIKIKQQGDEVFVGVLRSASKGKANIAEIQEFGSRPIVVPITPRSRRFLMAAFRSAGLLKTGGKKTGIAVIRIPPRPFITPVVESALFKEATMRKRYEHNLSIGMGGMLGTA